MLFLIKNWRLIASFALATALATVTVFYVQRGNEITSLKQAHKLQLAAMELASSKKLNEFQQAARNQEQINFNRYVTATEAANAKIKTLQLISDNVRAESNSLRNTVAKLNASLPAATESARIKYATTAATLLAECAEEYRSVAQKADEHAIDAERLLGAYPKQGTQ